MDARRSPWNKRPRPKNTAASYSEVFDRRFAANISQGFASLTKLMQHAQPGFGYSVLATLMAKSKHKAVVTTNFDSLIERALLYYTDHTPLTCTDETAAGAFDKDLSYPLIVKCHRDLHLHPHNGGLQTSTLHDNFGKALVSLLPGKVLIAVGYGGNDPSLMRFLEGLPKEQWPVAVYWCYWDEGGLPSQRILDWVAKHNGRLVAIPGFDQLMSGIKAEFGFDFLVEEMQFQHVARIKRYRDQVEQIVSRETVTEVQLAPSLEGERDAGGGGPVTKQAAPATSTSIAASSRDGVNFASESITKTVQAELGPKSWWTTLLSILPVEDPAAKDAAFKVAMSDYPKNREIFSRYADFLEDSSRHGEAESVLDTAITFGESQPPGDERALATDYNSRAGIRQLRGDLAGAAADIKKSIDWYEAQSPRNERGLAILYANRAGIRRDVASRARTAGDAAAATAGFKAARADIETALTWYLANLPSDERALAILHETKASIDAAERGD